MTSSTSPDDSSKGPVRHEGQLADLVDELNARAAEADDSGTAYQIRRAAQYLVIAEGEVPEETT